MKRVFTVCVLASSIAQAVNFDDIEEGCCDFYTEPNFKGDMQTHCDNFSSNNIFNTIQSWACGPRTVGTIYGEDYEAHSMYSYNSYIWNSDTKNNISFDEVLMRDANDPKEYLAATMFKEPGCQGRSAIL